MALTNKTFEDKKAALEKNMLSIQEEETQDSIIVHEEKSPIPSENDIVKDSEEDFSFSRNSIKDLIKTSTEAIQVMFELASNCENPQAFSVLADMLKTTSDMNGQLMIVHKRRKDGLVDKSKKKELTQIANSTTTNNIVFTGTTTDLQKMISDKLNPPVDV